MFGTLNHKQHKEPLTFIENTNRASALSRSRRDKPHVSCEFCRSRKVRCSGQPSGCDRCIAVSAECRYPGREARRRKAPASRQIETLRPSSSMSSSDLAAGTQEQVNRRGEGQGQELEQPSVGVGNGQAGRIQPHTAVPSVEMCDVEPRGDQGQQQMEHRLSSYSVGDGSSNEGVLDGLDKWLDMDSFLHPMLTAPLENLDGSVEMLDETREGSLSGDADSLIGKRVPSILGHAHMLNMVKALNIVEPDLAIGVTYTLTTWSPDFNDMGPGASPSSFPNADNLAQSSMPSYSLVSPFASTMPSTRSQPPSSGTNNNYTGQEPLSLPPSLGRWSGQTPTTFNNVRPSPGPPDRLKPSPTTDPHPKIPAPAAAAAAFLQSLSSRGDAKDGCRCLHLMACLLEELGAERARSDPATMDLLLGYLRWALVRCTTVLNCERCTSLSDNNMLLAMVGQYMSTICERIVMCYIELQWAQEQRQTKQQPSITSLLAGVGGFRGDQEDENGGTGLGSGASDADDIWFSTYRIDDGCERMQVLQCLARVQLTKTSRLLEKLKARAGSRRGHLVLLTEAEKRIKAVRLMLRARLDGPSAGKI